MTAGDLIDATQLEHRLTTLEQQQSRGEERLGHKLDLIAAEMRQAIGRVEERQEEGFTAINQRLDITNGKVLALQDKEKVRSERELRSAHLQEGARAFRLGIKGWTLASLGIIGAAITVIGGIVTLADKLQ